ESMLGKIRVDSPHYYFDSTLLEKQVDGVFCTDGTLLCDQERSSLIYLYRYRNEYLVMDTNLNQYTTGHTIDTNSFAKVKVGILNDGQTRKLAALPLTVNATGTINGDWLFVQSAVLARNERPTSHDKATVIDAYRISSQSYQFSFYIYDYAGKEKLRQLDISSAGLVARFDTHITIYELRDKYFSTKDFARTNRMKDQTPVNNSRLTLSLN